MDEHTLVLIFAAVNLGLILVIREYAVRVRRLSFQLKAEKRKTNRLRASLGYPGGAIFKQEERPAYAIVGDLWIDRAGVTRRMIDEDGVIPGGEWTIVNVADYKVKPGSSGE